MRDAPASAEELSTLHPSELVVLLGAGASVEAGVPTSTSLTEALLTAIERYPGGRHAEALHSVHALLAEHDAREGSSPPCVDVERLFSAVELLGDGADLEVTPLIREWEPHVRAHARPQHGALYRELASRMVDALRPVLATSSARVAHLMPLVRAADRPGGLTVVSLNYDIALEQAHADLKGPAWADPTSIDRWGEDHLWDWDEDGLRLLKLHGSIGWGWATLAG